MNSFLTSALRPLRHLLLLGAMVGGSAHAAVYTGVWDPPFGAPFTADFGWRGTAEYFVPDSCVPGATVDVNNIASCGGGAIVTAAQVELFDTDSPGTTLATLNFTPATLVIGTLRFVSGELTQLTTSLSNYLNPWPVDLSAYGVGSGTEFSLFFDLTGPRLAARNCYSYSYDRPATNAIVLDDGPFCSDPVFNDNVNFSPEFVITRVPEPGTLALACLALLMLAPRKVRATLLPQR